MLLVYTSLGLIINRQMTEIQPAVFSRIDNGITYTGGNFAFWIQYLEIQTVHRRNYVISVSKSSENVLHANVDSTKNRKRGFWRL